MTAIGHLCRPSLGGHFNVLDVRRSVFTTAVPRKSKDPPCPSQALRPPGAFAGKRGKRREEEGKLSWKTPWEFAMDVFVLFVLCKCLKIHPILFLYLLPGPAMVCALCEDPRFAKRSLMPRRRAASASLSCRSIRSSVGRGR